MRVDMITQDSSYTGQYAQDFVQPASPTLADLTNYVLKTTTITPTAPLTGGGDLSANRAIAIPAAAHGVDGYLKGVDWDTFNAKQAALGFTAANDASVVHTTGNESVGGIKTFTAGISFGNETLSNYDEGNWAPTSANLGGTGITYSTQFTRVGNRIDFAVVISGTGVTATANSTYITLPATPAKAGACAVTNPSVAAYGPALIYTDGKLYLPTITSTGTIVVSGTFFV